MSDRQEGVAASRRDPLCVERWPECNTGEYDPRCCRFPKSCSCTVYEERPGPPAASRYDEAEELASQMSYRPLSPEQSERGVDVVLGLVSRLREAEKLIEAGLGIGPLADPAKWNPRARAWLALTREAEPNV